MYGKTAAFRAVMLLSVSPIYAAVRLMMTERRCTAWAAVCIFCKGLLADRRYAWRGAAFAGLGMLSIHIAPRGRFSCFIHWTGLRGSGWCGLNPTAALIALALFSPVIVERPA